MTRKGSFWLLGRVSIGSALVGLTFTPKLGGQPQNDVGKTYVSTGEVGAVFSGLKSEGRHATHGLDHSNAERGVDSNVLDRIYPRPVFGRIEGESSDEPLSPAHDLGLDHIALAHGVPVIVQPVQPDHIVDLDLPQRKTQPQEPISSAFPQPSFGPSTASNDNIGVAQTANPTHRDNGHVQSDRAAFLAPPIDVLHGTASADFGQLQVPALALSTIDASLAGDPTVQPAPIQDAAFAPADASLPAAQLRLGAPAKPVQILPLSATQPVVPVNPEAMALLDPVEAFARESGEPMEEDEEPSAQESGQANTDLTPGRQTFPVNESDPAFSYDDELILQLRVTGTSATDTIIAYGNRSGVYLPLGEMARLLDLPIQVSDDGNYASGWFLSEDRRLTINLQQGVIETSAGTVTVDQTSATAFDGELFLRADVMASLFPLEIETDLRSQAIILTTLEPFPFEERMRRTAERERLNSRANVPERAGWPRQETPWAAISVPMADVELRTVSDTARGTRGEIDLRLAGDLAFLTAQTFFSASTRDGLTAAIVELGRRDADADLLGPLEASEFLVGDVATSAMPLGLRGASGRGAYISNQSFDGASVFDEIDFRGVLPDGYEVELYRNDVLLGSTRDRVNGQYEFLQIPVDFGLNVFRLVFYGPQGQRREEVRRISVGDGRLAPGEFVYSAGVVERGVNLLGVEGPDFRRDARYGDWQAISEISYGFNRDFTGTASAAFFEDRGEQRYIATTGIRTGIGGLAVRGDLGLSDGGGRAFGVGLGGRALNSGFRLTHFEYAGRFLDELRATGTQPLERATELDFNTSLELGGDTYLPLTLRGRRTEYQDGRLQTSATARASLRLPGIIGSKTLSYIDFSAPGTSGFSQLVGNFDLTTFDRSATQVRGSLGYRVHPDVAITQVAAEVSHAIDDRTVVRGSAAYAFDSDDAALGLSAIRQFDNFTLALDGQYNFGRQDYAIALRVNLSLGRDPLRNKFFVAQPGLSSSGAVAVRAFHDLDGDRAFGPHDRPLPDVTFSASNGTAQTDPEGFARLGQLGNGNRAVVQVDPSSLPDIFMAPVTRGVEIVPRAGRFHVLEFPIVELSEVEGTVSFLEDASSRGVAGLRLQLLDEAGELQDYVRTERGGYFFFERVMPGTYNLVIDPEQAERLNLCLAEVEPFVVGTTSDIYKSDLTVSGCPVVSTQV